VPTILDLIYRQYCRARLAEMRKQLLLRAASREVSEANCDVDRLGSSAGEDDRTATQQEGRHLH
jgi:hypothetical protein